MIIAHRDLDGAASALILSMEPEWRESRIRLVDHSDSKTWALMWERFSSSLSEKIAILDLPPFPVPEEKKVLFVDHHSSASYGIPLPPHWEIYHDPSSPCAAEMVMKLVSRETRDDKRARDAALFARITDLADFASASEALDLKNPVSLVMHLVPHLSDDHILLARLRFQFDRMNITDAILSDATKQFPVFALENSLDAASKALRPSRDRVAIIDWTSPPLKNHLPVRFVEFRETGAVASVRAMTKNGRTSVSLGINPWNKPACEIDLSKIASRYGGGGHPFASGFTLPRENTLDTRHLLEEVARDIQEILDS